MKTTLLQAINTGIELFSKEDYTRLNGLEMKNIDGNAFRFAELRKAMITLPKSVLNEMIQSGTKIIYSKNEEPVNNGGYAGFYNTKDNLIYIWDDSLTSHQQFLAMLEAVKIEINNRLFGEFKTKDSIHFKLQTPYKKSLKYKVAL